MRAKALAIIEVLSSQPSLGNMRTINLLAKYLQGSITESVAISTANSAGFILIPTTPKKRYKDNVVHYSGAPCRPQTPYPVETTSNKEEITCKRCREMTSNIKGVF